VPTDRYARQRQVREVGASGQQRLERLSVVVPANGECELEALYLERAGVRVERCAFACAPAFPFGDEFSHDGPRAVSGAAHAALQALREGLGLAGPSSSGKARLS
jgi:hypothetical protein